MAVDAGSIYSEVRVRLDLLKQDISSVEAEFDKFGTKNKEQTTKVEQDWSKGFNAASIAGVAAFVAIGAAVKQAIAVFAEFDDSMAQVHAVMSGSEQDFADLENAALAMGSSTHITAKEAADALYILSKSGRDAAESIQLLHQAELLAGASGGDLNTATKLLVQIMNQFKIGADEAGRIVEVLAAAKMPLEDFGSTLATIGPVAAGMGIPLENLVAVIKLLSKTGLESGQSTMALKTILGDLSDSMSPLVLKLNQLGVSYDKVNPSTNSFAQIIGNLTKAGIGAEQAMAAFGNRAGPVMVALLAQGEEGIQKYTESITGTNSAAEMYEKRNATLADSFKEVNNALEVSGNKIIKEFSPALQGLMGFLKDVINFVGNLPGPLKVFFGVAAIGIPVILGIAAAVQILGTVLTASAGIISIIVLAVAALAAGFSLLPHLIDPVTIALDQVKAAHEQWMAATDSLNKSLAILNQLNKELTDSTNTLTDAERKNKENRVEMEKQNVIGSLEKQINATLNMINTQNNLKKQMEDNLATQKKYREGMAADEERMKNGEIVNIATWKVELQKLSDQYDEFGKIQTQNTDNMDKSIDALAREVMAGIVSIDTVGKQGSAIRKLVEAREDAIRKGDIQAAKEAADAKTREEAAKRAAEAALKYKQATEYVTGVLEEQKTTLEKLQESLAKLQTIRLKGADEVARQKAIAITTEKIREEQEKLNKAKEKAATLLDEYKSKLDDLFADEIEKIKLQKEATLAQIDVTKEGWQEAAAAVEAYYDAIIDKAKQDQAIDAFKSTFDTITSLANQMGSALQSILSAVAENRMADLDAQLQAELEAAGVAEETAVEKAQAELDAAVEGGDAIIIAEKQRALTRAQIEEDFQKRKAQIEYQAAHDAWLLTLALTAANAAAAVVKVFPNIPLMIAAGVIGIASIAGVALAEPKPPTFEYGGIVMGDSYSGDRLPALVNSGEMILTREQQAQVWAMANGSGQGSTARGIMQVQLYMDMRKVAEGTAEYFEGGLVRLVL
jgi:TP901 family phage tail tape measure protein